MAIEMTENSHITTEQARAVMLPRLHEWFGLDEGANILSDVAVDRTGSGDAVITIQLATLVRRDEYEAFEQALRERRYGF